MSPAPKLALLAVAAVLLVGALTPASAGASATYKLNREGFRITLVLKGKRLVRLRIRVRENCSDGTTPIRTFYEQELHRVPARGRLLYVDGYNTEYGYAETRLSIHVTPRAIKGAFFDIDSEGYVCATGHSGNRTRNFTARRIRPAKVAASAARFDPFDERCEYIAAGPPGPAGNRLLVVGEEIYFRRDGEQILASYRGPRCSGRQATVHNIDRIVVRHTEHEGVSIDERRGGRFGPGATPEPFASEIEFTLETESVEIVGTDGPDSIRVRTLPSGRVAFNLDPRADGPRPDYDVTLTGIPYIVKIRGSEGKDLIDARRLTGMGDNQLNRVIRLFGEAGDDVMLGSPGGEWRLKDGPGDDLVVTGGGDDSVDFGRGRDRIYGGPGNDDLIYSAFVERFTRQPNDAADRLYGGPGPDQIIDLDGRSDLIRCGPGYDDVEREKVDHPAADCEHLRF